MKKTLLIIILLTLLASFPANAQCAMCRAVLESGEGGQSAEGINNGIVYLMAFPYLLMGIVGYFVYKSRKRAKQEEVA